MAATAQEFADFLEPGLSNIWHDAFPKFESRLARVYNKRKMEKNTITDKEMAGFGDPQTQNDGAEITFDEPTGLRTKTYTYRVRGLAYRVHERLWKWDLYGEVEKWERDLADSLQNDLEQAGADILNNAFGTTNTGFDGLQLCSTAHTRLDGGANQTNRPATDEALSLGAVHSGLITIRQWLNHRGRPRQFKARRLIIPEDLMITVYELLDSKLHPENANNTANVLVNRFGLEDPVIWEHLTSATAWFIQCDQHDLNYLTAFGVQTGMRTDWKTESIERKARQGYIFGFGKWEGLYGTDGVA